MPDITIDPGAVESARISILMVRDTLNGLHAQHESVFSDIERMVNDVTTSVMEALDPFGIWERFGFDSASYRCQSIRGSLEQAHSDTDRAVELLCETHSGELAPMIHNRSGELRSAISASLDSLWTITSFFNLGNVIHMVKDPSLIQEHFSNSRRALYQACIQAQSFSDYLGRLKSGEDAILDEIANTFITTSPSLICSPQGNPVRIQSDSTVLQVSWSALLNDTPLSPASIKAERAAIIAEEVSKWLTIGNDGYGHDGFNHIDWSKVPDGKDGNIAKQLQKIFAESPGDWLFGNNKYNPDVQCVALVSLSYQIATGKTDVMPPLGNADHLWKAYANNAVPGWSEVTNKVGSPGWPPRVGDVMVSTSRCHVAIVTGVDYNPDGSVKSITITQANTDKFTQTYNVENGSIDPHAGADGFLRYTG